MKLNRNEMELNLVGNRVFQGLISPAVKFSPICYEWLNRKHTINKISFPNLNYVRSTTKFRLILSPATPSRPMTYVYFFCFRTNKPIRPKKLISLYTQFKR